MAPKVLAIGLPALLALFMAWAFHSGPAASGPVEPARVWVPPAPPRRTAPAPSEVSSAPVALREMLVRWATEARAGQPGCLAGFARILEEARASGASSRLLRIATGSAPKGVREVALYAAALGDREVARETVRRLATNGSEVRCAAILALAATGEVESETLGRLLRSGDPQAATAAALALVCDGRSAALSAMASVLSETTDPAPRLAVYRAIAGDERQPPVGQALRSVVGRGLSGLRDGAVGAGCEARLRLVRAMGAENDPWLVAASVRALSLLRGQDAAEEVLRLWDSAGEERAPTLIRALRGSRHPGLWSALSRRVSAARHATVRRALANQMWAIPVRADPEVLRRWCARENDAATRRALERLLAGPARR